MLWIAALSSLILMITGFYILLNCFIVTASLFDVQPARNIRIILIYTFILINSD